MKRVKYILILTIFAILLLCPNFVQAAEITVDSYDALKEAIADETISKIVLSSDIAVTDDPGITIGNERNIVIDLNGKTLSMNSEKASTSYLINNKGTLTIKDSTDSNKNGTGNGKIVFTSTNPDMASIPSYASNTITNSGSITLESGLIENNTKKAPAAYAIDNNSSGHDAILNINGGKISSTNNWGIRMFVNSNTNQNNVHMNNGLVNGGIWMQTLTSQPKANFTVNNGTITGNRYAFYIYDPSSNGSNINVKINGGEFISKAEEGYALYLYHTSANVEINDGIFTGYYALIYFTYNKSESITNVINNGTFNGYVELDEKFTTNPEENYDSNFCIKNGKFSNDIYVWAYDGNEWYLSTNTKFIKGGVFATIKDGEDDCCWPELIVEPLEATGIMKTTPNGYPYTVGHKIVLSPNYEGKEDIIIYTLNNGSMSELEDITRDAYTFIEWNTKQDGTGNTITKNSIINGNTTLYAQWKLTPGNIDAQISSDETINITVDTNEIGNSILTEEEKEIIDSGKNIKVEVIVKDITENISAEEKEKIAEKIEDRIIGAYIDISIFKTIEGEEPTSITNTDNKVKFTINIPDELIDTKNPNREFYIVRMHDGNVEVLNSEYNAENHTLTFETDKFSTYAIAYTDLTNPKTGDNIAIWVGILLISFVGIVGAKKFSGKKKKSM